MSFYESFTFRIDDRALDNLLNSPRGEVGRYMRRIGFVILQGARAMVGVDTTRLRRSLYMKHDRHGRYQYVQVGSNVRYAYWHHEGTKPHEITADPGRLLRFRVGGRVVFVKKTQHPGFRGRKYLTVPMERAVRR